MTQPTTPDPFDADEELQARIAETQREYGTYVADVRIYAGGALAYDVGHPVPVSNVVRHGYFLNGQVSLVDSAEHPPEMLAVIGPAATPTTRGRRKAADETEGAE